MDQPTRPPRKRAAAPVLPDGDLSPLPVITAKPPRAARRAKPAAPVLSATTQNPPASEVAASQPQKETAMDTIETATAFGQDAAAKGQAFFTEAQTRAKSAMEKGTTFLAEVNEFGKGNVEAMVESSKIAAKGVEALGQEAADYTRRSFENATQAMKGMAAAKSPTEFMKLQSDFVRGAFDAWVAESSKSTEAAIKLAGDVVQPLSSRVSLAVEKAKVAA